MSTKEKVALLLHKLFIGKVLFGLNDLIYGKHIRVVNYHSSQPHEMENFERQLQFYLKHYTPATYEDLEHFFKTGKWDKLKPGLIISFDDGLRENFDYAVPILEKYGFKGWFFIPAGLINASSEEQLQFIGKSEGKYPHTYDDGRYFMTWDELKYLTKAHVLGCHTFTHHRMNVNDSETLLTKEISDAKQLMQEKLGAEVTIFCWVGGEEHTYTHAAAKKIKDSGYRYSFMTNSYPLKPGQSPLQIQRTNVEARFPMHLVKFQLSPLMDLLYSRKRKRVCKLTEV